MHCIHSMGGVEPQPFQESMYLGGVRYQPFISFMTELQIGTKKGKRELWVLFGIVQLLDHSFQRGVLFPSLRLQFVLSLLYRPSCI